MKCQLNKYKTHTTSGNLKLNALLEASGIDTPIIHAYYHFLNTDGQRIQQTLIQYFDNPDQYPKITPIILYNEESNQIITIMASQENAPPEPGEYGSILSYIRAHGYNDNILCSDCYGQLSCSSCAVEVLAGEVENPEPREEEYDMLDIDEAKPPTKLTRLSCQACIGTTPLVIKVRAACKILSKA
jgi:ferredoxin